MEHLQTIAFAIRSSYNRVLNCSPAELVYNRNMMFPRQINIDLQQTLLRICRQLLKDNNKENFKRVSSVQGRGQSPNLRFA